MSNKIITTALAAYGMSGKLFHAPFLHTHEGFRLKTVVERSNKQAVEQYPYVQSANSFEEVLNDSEIELVVINTPDHLHYTQCKQALEAGKNVVVEKPFVLKSIEGQELMQLANEKKLLLSVYHNRRWDGAFQTVKKLIETNAIGRLVEFESCISRYRKHIRPHSWKENAENHTGTIFNLGSHLIDQALQLFGTPQSVDAQLLALRDNSSIDDWVHIRFYYPQLVVSLKTSYLHYTAMPRFVLHGTDGSFIKHGDDPQEKQLQSGMLPSHPNFGYDTKENYGILNRAQGNETETIAIETQRGNYMEYYADIYNSLINNQLPTVTAQQANQVIEIIEKCVESNRHIFEK